MSGVLRLSNNVTGRSTIIASASNDQTFTLPATGGTLLAGGSSLEVIFPSGTEALPGLHVQGDIDTGLYAPAANTLAISTDGTERLRVDSAGNVGIGTSSPSKKLHIVPSGSNAYDAVQIGDGLYIGNTSNNNNAALFHQGGGADLEIGSQQHITFTTGSTAGSATERMRIDSAGNVGIGTASPSAILDVADTIGNEPSLKLSAGAAANYLKISRSSSTGNYTFASEENGSKIIFATDPDGTGSVERLTVDRYGKVGIGTTSPAVTGLTIENAGASQGLELEASNGFAGGPTVRGYYRSGAAYKPLGLSGSQVLIGIQDVEKMRIDSSGNVGIGTTSIDKLLHVQGAGTSGTQVQIEGTLASAGLKFVPASGDNYEIQATTDSSLIVYNRTDAVERMRIDSSGRLLVGTSSAPTDTTNGAHYCKLVSVGNTSSSTGDGRIALCRGTTASSLSSGNGIGEIHFADSAGGGFAYIAAQADGTPGANDYPGRLLFATTADGASSPTERMRISSKGRCSTVSTDGAANVLATTVSASTSTALIVGKHSSNGSVDNGTDCFVVRSNGNVENTNNSYGAISDAKLKENIVDANSQWNDLKAIQVRNYNFIEGQTHTQIGVVAQEVETVSPGLVTESPDRDAEGEDLGTVTKSVNYSVLYMKAVKALQEAMDRIETLEQRLSDAGIA